MRGGGRAALAGRARRAPPGYRRQGGSRRLDRGRPPIALRARRPARRAPRNPRRWRRRRGPATRLQRGGTRSGRWGDRIGPPAGESRHRPPGGGPRPDGPSGRRVRAPSSPEHDTRRLARYPDRVADARARTLRGILFDAGNTLVQMNYAAIARQLLALGHTVRPSAVRRAEWRARVRLDDGVLARPGSSTESRSVQASYVQLMLDELGITDPATAQALAEWRRTYNAPVGLFDVADPEGQEALVLARASG